LKFCHQSNIHLPIMNRRHL